MPRREKIKVRRAEPSLPGALAPGWFAASRRVWGGGGVHGWLPGFQCRACWELGPREKVWYFQDACCRVRCLKTTMVLNVCTLCREEDGWFL